MPGSSLTMLSLLPLAVGLAALVLFLVKAENEKVAAVDFATATETMADGARRAEIKRAEGIKQAKILAAEGEALAIPLVNEAADRYFVGNAQLLERLIILENALSANTKFVLPSNAELVNIIGDMGGILPLARPPDPARSTQPLNLADAHASLRSPGRQNGT